jgi:hypothetical protein
MQTAIAYVRVSTDRQGRSGLGLEAQKSAIQRFAEQEGFEITQNFTEVQSGKDDDQPGPSLQPRSRPRARPRRPSSLPSSIACRAMSPSSPV